MDKVYYVLDGDDIGKKFESFIFKNDLNGAREFSNTVKSVMKKITYDFENSGCSCYLNAGDSLIFVSDKLINLNKINLIHKDITFSMGIGYTIIESSLNLKIAKSTGKKTFSNIQLIKDNIER